MKARAIARSLIEQDDVDFQAVVRLLGGKASWEHPGFIDYPLMYGNSLAIGDVNGPIDADFLVSL